MVAVSKSEYSEEEIRKWREEAYRYAELPVDYRVYQPGNYPFQMKSGDVTDHWIRPVRGIRTVLKWASSNGSFKVEHRDGTIVDISKGEKLPENRDSDFRIHAVNDTLVLLRVIEE